MTFQKMTGLGHVGLSSSKTEMRVVMLDVSLFVRIIEHAVGIKLDIKLYF